MTIGSFVAPKQDAGVEQISPVTVTIPPSGVSGAVQLSPKAMTTPASGIRLNINASVVNGATALTGGTVGGFINEIEILQGSRSLIKFTSIAELLDFYHIKTGQTLSDVALPTTASQTDSANLEFLLPFNLAQGAQIVVKTIFNGYSTAVTGGSVTSASGAVGVAFYYTRAPIIVSEDWEVMVTPSALGSGTDQNLGLYLANKPIYDLWTDVIADANLAYYKFKIGKSDIYYDYPFDLIEFEDAQPQFNHESGLFRLPLNPGININTASNSQAQALINLSASKQIIIYARTS